MDQSFIDYIVLDLMQNIAGITYRKMFGGAGLYKDKKIFGMIVEDKVYFKFGQINKADFEKHKSKPFTYNHKEGKTVSMSYYEVPESILENQEDLKLWIEKAVQASNEKK